MRPDFPLPDVTWEPTAEYWAGAARGELRLPACTACGRFRWYPEEVCRHCGERVPVSWTTVSGQGTLFSWVVVTHAFLRPFAPKVPFVSALVAVDEDPAVRLPTQIVDCEPEGLAFEMPVMVTFRPLTFEGVTGAVMAPLFAPARVSSASGAG
jgi:uncharacterized protein